MEILYGYQGVTGPLGPVVMTIGTYDGLHVGHRAIVQNLVRRARKTGARALVYSFYPPPWRVIGRAANPYLILTLQDKIDELHRLGVDILVTEEFTPALQEQSHVDFAEQVLRDRLAPQEIHFGYDFRFGKDRKGDAAFLTDFFAGTPTEVRPHGAVRVDGEVVGCRLIRQRVCAGDMQGVGPLLGRHHYVSGVVVRGRNRGNRIGFPTANVQPSTELIPPAGVYPVQLWVGREDEPRPGVANLGFRPTFAEQDFSIEVHLFDFDGDLYGERVRVDFVDRVRDEMKFDGVDALVAQIRRDAAQVRAMLPYAAPRAGAITWDPKP